MISPAVQRKILLVSIMLVSLFILMEIVLSQLILPRLTVTDIRLDSDLAMGDQTFLRISGLENSNSYLSIHEEEMAQRFASVPQVEEAFVEKRFPSTLIVRIRSRQAVALLWKEDLTGQGLMAVDSKGYIFPHDQGIGQWNLPVINGVDLASLSYGDQLDESYLLLLQDLKILHDDYPSYFRILSEIRVIPQDGEVIGLRMILTTHGTAARCSLPLDKNMIEKAILVLDVIQEQGMDRNIEEVDIRRDSLGYRKREV